MLDHDLLTRPNLPQPQIHTDDVHFHFHFAFFSSRWFLIWWLAAKPHPTQNSYWCPFLFQIQFSNFSLTGVEEVWFTDKAKPSPVPKFMLTTIPNFNFQCFSSKFNREFLLSDKTKPHPNPKFILSRPISNYVVFLKNANRNYSIFHNLWHSVKNWAPWTDQLIG